MQDDTVALLPGSPGVTVRLRVLRFGTPGARPKAVIQAALHADEVPGILVVHRLRERLAALEAAGALLGEVVLVPHANPLGAAQHLMGQHHGRFDWSDGGNYNRGHPDLAPALLQAVGARLGDDEGANRTLIRGALRDAAAALGAVTPAQDLKRRLVQQAVDADIVLDLHCDGQACLHVYGLTPQADTVAELGALLGARAVLLATESGDSPFDESCSRPWWVLQQAFPQAAVPLACFSATVELRGEADTSHALAQQDADGLVAFLRHRGIVAGGPGALPPALCVPTPLSGSEPVMAPHGGVVVFHRAPGEPVAAGDVVADITDPDTGAVTPLRARSAGVLYARVATRWATPGKRLAKIAGTSLVRTGKLLSP